MTVLRRYRQRVLIGLVLSIGFDVGASSGVRAAGQAAQPPPPAIQLQTPGGLYIRKNVKTFLDFKRERAVLQRYDFSCGAAALATLMQSYYKLNVTEASIVVYIIHMRGAEEAVKRYKEKKGFSLLDLKLAAQSAGFRCPAYRDMTLADLVALDQPAIVPIRTRSFDHFVLFRGVEGDRVYLSDPVAGNVTMKAGNFIAIWHGGIGMVFESKTGLKPVGWKPDRATQGFYVPQDMVRTLSAPSGLGFQPKLAGEF